jgi:hypothetical protein
MVFRNERRPLRVLLICVPPSVELSLTSVAAGKFPAGVMPFFGGSPELSVLIDG